MNESREAMLLNKFDVAEKPQNTRRSHGDHDDLIDALEVLANDRAIRIHKSKMQSRYPSVNRYNTYLNVRARALKKNYRIGVVDKDGYWHVFKR